MDHLISVTDLKVFGCSIEFSHLATQTHLEDPIWDRLQQSKEYCIIFRDCSEFLPSQELLEGYLIAVHVPMNPESAVPEGAFAGAPRPRHASVESGIRLIGPEAWHSCRQLRIVKLPSTVVSISDNAFRSCELLNSVAAPGCRDLAIKPLMSAAHCSGSIPLKITPIGLAAAPSLGITSSEAVSTLPNLPCTRVSSQASCCRNPLPGNWP